LSALSNAELDALDGSRMLGWRRKTHRRTANRQRQFEMPGAQSASGLIVGPGSSFTTSPQAYPHRFRLPDIPTHRPGKATVRAGFGTEAGLFRVLVLFVVLS
jgi:hypothetical protein